MSTALVRRRFEAAWPHYNTHAKAQQQIVARLMTMLPPQHYPRILELGCGSGLLTQELYRQIGTADWICNDLSTDVAPFLDTVFQSPYRLISGDAAAIDFPPHCDLIAAASCIQWLDDLPHILHKTAAALNPSGLFLFNTFTPDNLPEIRTLTGQGLHYPTPEQWHTLFAPHFELRQEYTEKIVLYFDKTIDVLRHLQKTGVTAAGEYRWTRHKLQVFSERYAAAFSTNGKLTLTYTPLYYLLEKKE